MYLDRKEGNSFNFSEFPYLKQLVSSPENADELSTHVKAIIRLFTPCLEKSIIAREFVSELKSRDVINDVDEEHIRSTFQNQGNTYATIVLLQKMQCRVSPQKWYYEFLKALLAKGYEKIVKEMEPDFLTNPSAFMPDLGTYIR